MDKFRIYSIIHKPEQVSEYIRYDNSHIRTIDQKSYLFEYNPIIDIIDNHDIQEEYLGIFSYKFHSKTGILKKKLYLYLNNTPGYDFYSFSKYSRISNFISSHDEKSHPGFNDILVPICEDLELPYLDVEDHIYENFFITRLDIYKEYVNKIIKPAIELLDTKYKDLAFRDAKYLPNKNLHNDTGLEHYTFHTFVLERLINSFIKKNNYTVKNFNK